MRRSILTFLLMVILFLGCATGPAQTLSASISPSSISTRPAEKEKFSLTVRNMGGKDIDVTGIRLRVTSKELFGAPIALYLGEYSFPFDKPERVAAGSYKVIERTVEIPLIPFAGDFDVDVIVETTGGIATTSMRVHLAYSWLSIAFLLLALLVTLGVLYAVLKLTLRRIRGRDVYRVSDLLAERDRYYRLLRELEGRKGRMGEREYSELREEYTLGLRRVQSMLEGMLPSLQEKAARLEREIEEIDADIRKIRARMEVREVKRSEAEAQIRRREVLVEERRKMLRELRALIDSIRGA